MQRLLLVLTAATASATEPADRVPTPSAERCVPFVPLDVEGDDTMVTAAGLDYPAVRTALSAVIQFALYCEQPAGMAKVHLTFDLTVGCDGLVSEVEPLERGGAPEAYVECVASVIRKADFPAHDLEDGQIVTYPVDVSW